MTKANTCRKCGGKLLPNEMMVCASCYARSGLPLPLGETVLEQSETLDGRMALTVRLADGTETVRVVDDIPYLRPGLDGY